MLRHPPFVFYHRLPGKVKTKLSEWLVLGPLVAQIIVQLLERDFDAKASVEPILNVDRPQFVVRLADGTLCEPEWRRIHREARENCARILREARENGRKDRLHWKKRRAA